MTCHVTGFDRCHKIFNCHFLHFYWADLDEIWYSGIWHDYLPLYKISGCLDKALSTFGQTGPWTGRPNCQNWQVTFFDNWCLKCVTYGLKQLFWKFQVNISYHCGAIGLQSWNMWFWVWRVTGQKVTKWPYLRNYGPESNNFWSASIWPKISNWVRPASQSVM